VKIAAALCWFDEPPETLRRCVSSLAGVADVVVALDGRWKVYPGPANISLLEQAEAIHEAAAAIGIPVVDESCRATQPWPSQIEKRAALMRLAAEHGHWTFVVDADEYVAEASSVELRAALQDTACDVAEVAIAATGRGVFDARPHPRRRIYRSSAAVGLERGHNGYRAAAGSRSTWRGSPLSQRPSAAR